jgi:hypothetical protein
MAIAYAHENTHESRRPAMSQMGLGLLRLRSFLATLATSRHYIAGFDI